MANEQNLKPKTTLSKEEAKRLGSKGGKASVKSRREKKMMKEQMLTLLSLPLKDERIKAKFEDLGIDTDDMDNQMALLVSLYQNALKGNVRATSLIMEVIGEKVIEVNVNQNIDDNVREFDKYVLERKTT